MADTERLFAEERQEKIIALLNERRKLLIPELCDLFAVSPATIRNDLNELERQGRLQRTHGGAIALSKTGFEPNFQQKTVKNMEIKAAIAKAAAELVEDGDTIALDTGTTTLALAQALTSKKNLTVVTNDIKIAALLDEQGDSTVILLGGTLRRGFYCTVGPVVTENLSRFRVDKCFLATNGLTLRTGLTTPDIGHAEIKKAMADISSQVYVVCDSSKIGMDSFAFVLPLSAVDTVITDNRIDIEEKAALEQADIDLMLVELP